MRLSLSIKALDLRCLDPLLLGFMTALVLVGFVAMSSASMEYAYVQYNDSFYHVVRHSVYLILASIAAVAVYQLPMSFWQQQGWVLLPVAFGLLVMVLIPGVGREVNGSQRWVALGPLTLQVSELVKICVLIYIAGYLVRREKEVRQRLSGFLKPMIVMSGIVVLLLAEPDFGAVVVIMGTVLGMMFLAGARLSQFVLLLTGCLGAAAIMVFSSAYRMKRLIAFTDPWADQYGSGYQLVQSLIAFGRGELFGVGLGNSVQKLFYLPEAHTDFVFAILAEEMGAVGSVLAIALFAALIARIFIVARKAEQAGQYFGAYIAYGTGLLMAIQVFINIGVNVGILPTKGLTLPFFSYGGSSLIACFVMLALVFRVDKECQHGAGENLEVSE